MLYCRPNTTKQREIIDGQQHLRTVEDFLNGKFKLAPEEDAEYSENVAPHIAGKAFRTCRKPCAIALKTRAEYSSLSEWPDSGDYDWRIFAVNKDEAFLYLPPKICGSLNSVILFVSRSYGWLGCLILPERARNE